MRLFIATYRHFRQGSLRVYSSFGSDFKNFALGIEVEILFVFVGQSGVEGRQTQKDWNKKPARTPKNSY